MDPEGLTLSGFGLESQVDITVRSGWLKDAVVKSIPLQKKDNSKLVGPYRGGELFRTTGAEWLAIQLSITGLWTRCPWSEPILDPRRASRSDGGKEKTPLKEENS